jgi:RND family efflux transporter MFP subunit
MLNRIRVVTARWHARAALATLILLTVAVAWLWAHEGHEALPSKGVTVKPEQGLLLLSPESREALGVQTAEVRQTVLAERLAAPAVVEAPWQRHAHATSRAAGTLTAIHVQIGQSVAAGQVLAEVQSPELENVQLELRTARNDLRLALETLRQLEAAGQRGAVSAQTVQEARTRHQENVNAVEIACRKLLAFDVAPSDVEHLLHDAVPVPLRTLPVKSPLAGVVVHSEARTGRVVEPSDPLFGIFDLSTVWLRIDVLEKDLPRIQVGQSVAIRWNGAAIAEETRTTVHQVGRALDAKTHLGNVWAALENSPAAPRFLPGMAGQAELTFPATPVLAAPETALVCQGAEHFVFVEEGPGQYVRHNVVPGFRDANLIELRLGSLVPGDRVVTAGSHELAGFFGAGVLRLSREAELSIGLAVDVPRKRPVAQIVTLPGIVELPLERRGVATARLPGTVQRILVERNQVVRAGDVIAEVLSPELHNLQLELLRNHLQLELLEHTLRQLQPLADQGNAALSQRQLRETQSAVRAARQRRDSLGRKLEAAGLTKQQVKDVTNRSAFITTLPVRAPIGGVVIDFPATLGQAVKADEVLCEIHDQTRPLVRAVVAERQLAMVRVGQSVRVRTAAYPNATIDGTVMRSGLNLESPDRSLALWIELSGKEPPLLHGMLARVDVIVGHSEPVLTLPARAVLREGTRSYVFKRRSDGVFDRRPLDVGRTDGEVVEIIRGLKADETVAVAGVEGLQTAFAALK